MCSRYGDVRQCSIELLLLSAYVYSSNVKPALINIGAASPHLFEGPKWQGLTKEWPWFVLLLCITLLAWCRAYNCWTRDAWKTPVVYSSDALAEMAMAKAYG